MKITIKLFLFIFFSTYSNQYLQAQILAKYVSSNYLYYTNSIVFDKSNNLYIGSVGNNIIKITSSGQGSVFVNSLPTNEVMAMASDKSGNLYVSTYYHMIYKITPDGTVSTFLNLGSQTATALAFDSYGNLFAAVYISGDYFSYNILEIDSSGNKSTFVNLGSYATALTMDLSNNLYVATIDNNLSKVTSSGSVSTLATFSTSLSAIAVDKSGNLFVADQNNNISKVSSSGIVSLYINYAAFTNNVSSLAFDNSGILYIGYSSANYISKVTNIVQPFITVNSVISPFISCSGSTSVAQNFTISGINLSSNIIITAPSGYELSNSLTGKYAATDTLVQSGGTVGTSTLYIRLKNTATGSPSGNISIVSTGATTQNIAVSGNVNALPTITLGTIAGINNAATVFSIPYTATSGNPNQYSITTGTTAMSGFAAVNSAVLVSSPINVTIPASAANTYNFNVTVKNSTTGCISVPIPINVVVTALVPGISSVSPVSGPVGTLVTITGTNLSYVTSFTIGGVPAIPISNSGNSAVVMVMPGSVTGSVTVNTVGSSVSGPGFTVTATKYPTIQQGSKLLGTGSAGLANQGNSVAISADGNTAVVGGWLDNNQQGAVWIFTRSGGVWKQQGNKLTGTGNIGAAQQGKSVSISADGNTVMIGGFQDNGGIGAAWVFTRTGGVWSQQGGKLVGSGNIGTAQQGCSVSLSGDGNTAIVGGNIDNNGLGAVWVFTRNGNNWKQQGTKLIGSGSSGSIVLQGGSVSLSADGNTFIVGGLGDSRGADYNGIGAAWIFTRSGSIWSQQGNKLVGTGNTGDAIQGKSVSISADGNTAIVGGSDDNNFLGAAWIFTRSGGVWTQQGNKLVGSGSAGSATQEGYAVSISADGNTAAIGGNADNYNQGATWVFTRNGNMWTQEGNKLTGNGNTGAADQGISLAISADGNSLIVGGDFDNSNLGASWVFTTGNQTINTSGTLSAFTNCAGTASASQHFTVSGTNLTGYILITAPAGFEISNSSSGKYGPTDTLVPVNGTVASTIVYIRSGSTALGTLTGNISIATTGASTQTIAVNGTVNALPTITLGTVAGVTTSATSFNIPYTATTGNPNKYSISTGTTAMSGFSTVSNAVLGSSPIVVPIPVSAANTYNFNLTVTNSTTGCTSNNVPVILVDYNPLLKPVINSIKPSNGPVGTLITINGNNLASPTAITIGGVSAIPISNNGSSLVAMVMPGAKTGVVSVATYPGIANGTNFTVTPTNYPSVQQGGKLTGQGSIGNAELGMSAAISADGNTAIVGGILDNNYEGAAWIFTRSNGMWSQQGNKLVGTSNLSAEQGWSVAISADGNTAIVGGNFDNNFVGAAWVFTRSNGVWAQQGNKLVGSGAAGQAGQGISVSLSADGNTAIVGGSGDNGSIGATWIYTRSNGVWSQLGNKLVGSGAVGTSQQGRSVSLSADGNTAVIGGNGDNNFLGAAWIFTRSGNVWAQQGNKLIGNGSIGNAQQGFSVAINADGNTAIIGGQSDNSTQGAIWIFTRNAGIWSQQGSKLIGTGNNGAAGQGWSVSISADGNTAIEGGYFDNRSQGAFWVFTRNGNNWIQQGSKLSGTSTVGNTAQGISVAISADGNTAIDGGIGNSGAAWIFTAVNLTPSITTTGSPGILNTCSGTASSTQSFTVAGSNLTGNIILSAPAGFELSNSTTGKYSITDTLVASGGNIATSIVYVRLSITASGTPSGNINITSIGATTQTIAVSGTLNALPPIPTITSKGSTSFCQGLYDILSSSSTTGNQWKLNGTAIAKASTSTNFVANVAGTYSVTVTNASGCSATSAATTITILPTPAKPVITEDANLNLVSSATKGNQWYSPELLTGDTSKVYTPWVNGTYYVQVTVGGCISPMSDAYVYNNPNLNKESLRATGTSTLDSKAVQLYPNPVGNTLKINYQISGIQNVTAEIMDMNGNIIARKESVTSGSSIDVSGYASGMYIIRLVNGENQEVLYTTKVMKVK